MKNGSHLDLFTQATAGGHTQRDHEEVHAIRMQSWIASKAVVASN
jgi:hypothetical protein